MLKCACVCVTVLLVALTMHMRGVCVSDHMSFVALHFQFVSHVLVCKKYNAQQ